MKFKIRLGRNVGFEVNKQPTKVSVVELRRQLRQMEKQMELQHHHINSLKRGFTWIKDIQGRLYQLYTSGAVADSEGYALDIQWLQGDAVLPNGAALHFRRAIDGALQEWVQNEKGKFIQIH